MRIGGFECPDCEYTNGPLLARPYHVAALIPFTILTGYLGSGKTTLLNRVLQAPPFRNCLVIVNELAELAIDGMRITDVDMEYVVLGNGCVCCTTQADLTSAVSQALFRRSHGLLPPFDRFILETTGAADPYALVASFGKGGSLSHLCFLEQVVTTVDGLLGEEQLDEHPEAKAAVQAADQLVITKTDLGMASTLQLQKRLVALNPLATISFAPDHVDVASLLSAGLRDAATGEAHWQRWLRLNEFVPSTPDARAIAPASRSATRHSRVEALGIVLEHTIDFRAWSEWVAQYVQRYGKRVLRLKAILFTDQFAGPIAFDAVREVVHEPVELSMAAVPDRRSRIVLLCRDIPELELRLLEAAVRATECVRTVNSRS